VDEGLKLEISKLKRDGLIDFNSWYDGRLTWTMVNTGEETGSIRYEIYTLDPNDMWMRLYYTYKSHWNDETEEMDYKLRLEKTQPNYGGKRLWFVCPLTYARVGTLYAPPGSKYFASRHAYSLKYQSQSRSAYDRAIDRMWKLKKRLGEDDYWRKPKGMHHKTHERMVEEIRDAEKGCSDYLVQYVMKRSGDRLSW